MNVEYAWDVGLVVLSLLTLILVISTLIIITCLRREDKLFNRRLHRQKLRMPNSDIDVSGLKALVQKMQNPNYNSEERKEIRYPKPLCLFMWRFDSNISLV